MKHIPFAQLPVAERKTLLEALLRSGVSPRDVCVSKLEPASAAEGGDGIATVTARGWTHSYEAVAGWINLLERDLLALRSRG